MVFIFFGLLITTVIITAYYYFKQNKQDTIGGKISAAKAFWLGYALFNYFVFPVYLYFFLENSSLKLVLTLIICLFYFRMLIQSFLMFISKNWIPTYGILYNIFSIIVILSLLVKLLTSFNAFTENSLLLLSLFLFKLILILSTDTIYAHKFKRLVGNHTKGKKAVWYASNDLKFKNINSITYRNNIFFSIVSITLITLMFFYDQY